MISPVDSKQLLVIIAGEVEGDVSSHISTVAVPGLGDTSNNCLQAITLRLESRWSTAGEKIRRFTRNLIAPPASNRCGDGFGTFSQLVSRSVSVYRDVTTATALGTARCKIVRHNLGGPI
jgi:hypothetical protein